MDKASGGDGIPAELFKMLKDDAIKELNSKYQQIWKIHKWPQDWKRSVFISIPKKGNAKDCSNYSALVLISHASKVMFKILQARIQQYVNGELLMSLLMRVKEESERAGLRLNIKKTEIMASSPITAWHIEGESWK